MPHKLAVITVIYENYTILTDYFASFNKQTDVNFHMYLIDNSQKKENITFPPYVTYLPHNNKGYASGVNQGIKKAMKDQFSMFAVINSDVTINDNFIERVKNSIEKNPQALIGGKIYYSKGYEYHKEKYNENELGNVLWYAGGTNDWKNCLTIHRGVDEVDKGQYNSFERTDFITGCLMCYDKTVVETVGSWDESFFLYFEDADYCERAKRKNMPLYYDPSIIIFHKNAQSTKGSGSKLHQLYQRNNQLRFGLKYAPIKTKLHLMCNYFLKNA